VPDGSIKLHFWDSDKFADNDFIKGFRGVPPYSDLFLRAMTDNMLFVACYGHKEMFEDRVPQTTILAFRNVALGNSR
jgi:hypothetical protein